MPTLTNLIRAVQESHVSEAVVQKKKSLPSWIKLAANIFREIEGGVNRCMQVVPETLPSSHISYGSHTSNPYSFGR